MGSKYDAWIGILRDEYPYVYYKIFVRIRNGTYVAHEVSVLTKLLMQGVKTKNSEV